MYGSIFRMKVKSGQEQRVADLLDEWSRLDMSDVKPKVDGAVGGLLLKPDGTSLVFSWARRFSATRRPTWPTPTPPVKTSGTSG